VATGSWSPALTRSASVPSYDERHRQKPSTSASEVTRATPTLWAGVTSGHAPTGTPETERPEGVATTEREPVTARRPVAAPTTVSGTLHEDHRVHERCAGNVVELRRWRFCTVSVVLRGVPGRRAPNPRDSPGARSLRLDAEQVAARALAERARTW
jgi:hypothetical protein